MDKLPCNQHYILGTRMKASAMEMMECLSTATYIKPPEKIRHLRYQASMARVSEGEIGPIALQWILGKSPSDGLR